MAYATSAFAVRRAATRVAPRENEWGYLLADDDINGAPGAPAPAWEPGPAVPTAQPEPAQPVPTAQPEPGPAVPTAQPVPAPAQYRLPPPAVPPGMLAPAYGTQAAYPPPPHAAPANTSRNWLGITSLVLGIVGGVVFALVFGFMSLSANKRGQANNRGLAIAGIAAAGAWTLLIAGGIGLAVLTYDDTIAFSEAGPGDCFEANTAAISDFEDGYFDFSACNDDTNGMVYFVTAVPFDTDYRADDIADVLFAACTTQAALVDVDLDIVMDYYVMYFTNSEKAWKAGDHRVVCGLTTEGAFDYAVAPGVTPNRDES